MTKVLLGLAVAALSGCAPEQQPLSPEEHVLERGKLAVAERLRDPGSARWRNLRVRRGYALCGQVNGTNAYGGYGGFEDFVYVNGSLAPASTDRNDHGAHLASDPTPRLYGPGAFNELTDPLEVVMRHCG